MKYKKRQILKWMNQINTKVFQWDTLDEDGNEVLYDGDLISICRRIDKYERVIGRLLGYARTRDNDFRSGEETYGYESLDSINSQLVYICDRCDCSFRLSWLKEVPRNVKDLSKLRRVGG